MNASLALLPGLVAGFVFLVACERTKHRLGRISGIQITLCSAVIGALCWIAAEMIEKWATGTEWPYIQRLLEWWTDYGPPTPFGTLLSALTIAYAAAWIGSMRTTRWEEAKKADQKSGDQIDWLIREAIDTEELVEISTQSGKIYIGRPRQSATLRSAHEQDIGIIPFMSGYRDTKTHEIMITTQYGNVLMELMSAYENEKEQNSPNPNIIEKLKKDIEIMQVIIPVREIVSARLFRLETYEKLQSDNGNNLGRTRH